MFEIRVTIKGQSFTHLFDTKEAAILFANQVLKDHGIIAFVFEKTETFSKFVGASSHE